ncbi:MAG: SDR family oxidoreductase [Elusimicrobiota bacterium]|jgi:nucleoside-diphosphate-sugar epimerase
MRKLKRLWLVTGGAGFIGSNIAEELARRGQRVRVLDNLSTGRLENLAPFRDRIEFVRGDIRDFSDCRKAVKGVGYILHQAAIRSVPKSVDNPMETHEANATGTLNMLMAAREAKVGRLVFASSSSVYGESRIFPQREAYRPLPVSPYAAQKLMGETYAIVFAKTFGLETVSLRYFNVFGPRQNPESKYSAVIPKFMESAYLGRPLDVDWDGNQSRDFTYVANVVQANIRAATSRTGIGETFNIANGRNYSLLDIIRVLEDLLGHKVERRHHSKRKGDVRKTNADISRAKRLLGYRPMVGFDAGLRLTWDYFVKQYAQKQSRGKVAG